LIYLVGDKYEGQWNDDMRHGWGRLVWADGNTFEGGWKNDNIAPGTKGIIPPPSVTQRAAPAITSYRVMCLITHTTLTSIFPSTSSPSRRMLLVSHHVRPFLPIKSLCGVLSLIRGIDFPILEVHAVMRVNGRLYTIDTPLFQNTNTHSLTHTHTHTHTHRP
jgi:hypothetical protein